MEIAARSVANEFAAGRIEQEPDFTSQFAGEARGTLSGAEINGFRWETKVLTDRGPGAQEKRYGADLLVVQHIDLPGYEVSKGFLAQAKLENRRQSSAMLTEQAEKMLRLTPESFLFLYGTSGIHVGSASAVQASQGNIRELRLKSMRGFLVDFLTSWVGDQRLSAAGVAQLEGLQEEHRARVAVGVFVEPLEV
jgi:hypothetical protein